MPVATSAHRFEKVKIYRAKEVIKIDNSDRTSTPRTFVAISDWENNQFLSLQMNEILKVELQFISSQCALDVSITVGKPEVHPIISLC